MILDFDLDIFLIFSIACHSKRFSNMVASSLDARNWLSYVSRRHGFTSLDGEQKTLKKLKMTFPVTTKDLGMTTKTL